jgi:hypothetical protein
VTGLDARTDQSLTKLKRGDVAKPRAPVRLFGKIHAAVRPSACLNTSRPPVILAGRSPIRFPSRKAKINLLAPSIGTKAPGTVCLAVILKRLLAPPVHTSDFLVLDGVFVDIYDHRVEAPFDRRRRESTLRSLGHTERTRYQPFRCSWKISSHLAVAS